MKKTVNADRPTTNDGRQYHLHTKPGDLAAHCLLVGDPGRADMIASKLFAEKGTKVGDHRGFKSYTGLADTFMPISVVTTGIGGASVGTVLPEAVRSGARRFIQVGSCAALQPEPKPGMSAIVTGAVRYDGASDNWAPIEFPAFADHRVVTALEDAAREMELPYDLGIAATTSCFNEGQARPDDSGYIPERLRARYEELVARGVRTFSMEAAAIFVWCLTHGGFWAGSVHAIYANRATNTFDPKGDETAARIAIRALELLSQRYPTNTLQAQAPARATRRRR